MHRSRRRRLRIFAYREPRDVTVSRSVIPVRIGVRTTRRRSQRYVVVANSWWVSVRTLTRVSLALILLSFVPVLIVTDFTGRSEIRHVESSLASTEHQLLDKQTTLARTQDRIQASYAEIVKLKSSTRQTQTSLAGTNASITSNDIGIFFAGIDVSMLDGCLGGVTQALDQVAVGQKSGALSSLASVTNSCSAINP